MEQWEAAQNPLQIIFNLQLVNDLSWFDAQHLDFLELLDFNDGVSFFRLFSLALTTYMR